MSTTGFPDSERWFGVRPDSYSPDICPEYSLAGRVRGTWRRNTIQRAYDQGKIDSLSPEIYEETLSPEEIEAIKNGPHPRRASGERLQPLEPDEVEITRIICWAMKKVPVIALYARPHYDRPGYALRFVSEFTIDIADYPKSIPRPLSLGELIELLDKSHLGALTDPGVLLNYALCQERLNSENISLGLVWYLAMRCLRRRWPTSHLSKAIEPVSAFYPNLSLSYKIGLQHWIQEQQRTQERLKRTCG